MDEARVRAYRMVLAQGLVHLKWDLACWYGGLAWLRPRTAWFQLQRARQAAFRAFALHNLAFFSSRDFEHFSEEWFWGDIAKFQADCPDAICSYRETFERTLRGEAVHVDAPPGAQMPA